MLADIDGDGLPDLVRATGSRLDCRAFWYKNQGGTFSLNISGAITLPKPLMPPSVRPVGRGVATEHQEAECSLAGAWWAHVVPSIGVNVCREGELHEHEILIYRWIDVDGDGRTDLVTEHYTDAINGHYSGRDIKPPDSIERPSASTHPFRCHADFNSYPDQMGNNYKWEYYRNVIGPDGPTLSAPMIWSVPAVLAGIPAQAEGSAFARQLVAAAPELDVYDIVDINGDHLPDLITQSFTNEQFVRVLNADGTKRIPWGYCSVDPRPEERLWQFNIYLGTGSGFSRTSVPMVIPEPLGPTPLPNRSDPNFNNLSCAHINDRRFVDVNGDGLPDLFWGDTSGGGGIPFRSQVFAYYGRGLSLDPRAVRFYDVPGLPGPDPLTPQQSAPAFPRDYDHDGMIDFPCLDGGCDQAFGGRGIAFGTGGSFNAAASAADSPDPILFQAPGWYPNPEHLGRTARLGEQDRVDPGYRIKSVIRDFVDLDADGVSEPYRLNKQDGSLSVEFWNPTDGNAPGLLSRVDNGKGATIQFEYARAANVVVSHAQLPDYARGWGEWLLPAFRTSEWLVRAVRVTASAGQQADRTSYAYQDPIFLADDGTTSSPGRRFRGFQAVTTTLPSVSSDEIPPLIFERFSYAKDPDGVLDYRALSEFEFDRTSFREGYQKQTRDQTIYTVETYLGGVRFVHPEKRIHVECQPSFDPVPCDNIQPPFAVITGYEYRGLASGRSLFTLQSGTTSALMWALESTTERTAPTTGRPTILRTHETTHVAVDGGALVLLASRIDQEDGRIAGHEDYFYDGATSIDEPGTAFGVTRGLLTKNRVYRNLNIDHISSPACGDGAECVDYGSWYDSATGDKVRDVRPSEMARAPVNGDPSRAASFVLYDYDSEFGLFPVRVTNPLGHTRYRSFDVGSGLKLSEFGPNTKIGRPPGCAGLCPAGPVLEERDWAYDGLGRLLTESVPHDDTRAGYLPVTVHTLAYPNFTTVTEQRALNWSGGPWSTTNKRYDGLGRLVEVVILLGASGQTPFEEHRYFYDSRGNLASSMDPDPTDDSRLATHAFTHDSRGRLTSGTSPDGTKLIVSYAPWEKTVHDADGGINRQLFDGFGQLRQVQESGILSSDMAITSYGYDGVGRLLTLRDADGRDTAFTYDGQGHRLSITRPIGKVWLYAYDADGNLVRKQDPDHRVTEYGYDALDRETTEIVRVPGLPEGVSSTELGLGRIDLTYDVGTNGIGRLTGVDMFDHIRQVPGELPYASENLGFDSLGNRARETWRLNLSATGNQEFSLERGFGPPGNILSEVMPGGLTAVFTYDARGKVETVAAGGEIVASYSYTVAGGVKTRRGPAMDVRTFSYDENGRLLKDQLLIGTASLERSYVYSGDGDVRTIQIHDAIDDHSKLDTSMIFCYDALHRLSDASGGSGLTYRTDLTYSPAGNVLTAAVTGGASTPDRPAIPESSVPALPNRGRNNECFDQQLPNRPPVTYLYGDGRNADMQAVTEMRTGAGSLVQFRYDKSGNMTDRIPRLRQLAATKYSNDNNDQIRRVVDSSGRSETYYYDYQRNRFLAVSARSWRFYLGADFELDVDLAPIRRQTWSTYFNVDGESVARFSSCEGACAPTPPERTLMYHDRRSDLMAAVDFSGAFQAHFAYGAFGEVLHGDSVGEADNWRRRFNSKEQDLVDGLSYYGFRYYDALMLRWVSSDPMYRFTPEMDLGQPQRLNLYSFSVNNPLRYLDSSGLSVGDPHIDSFGSEEFDAPYAYETLTTQRRKLGQMAGLGGSELSDFARTGRVASASQNGLGSQWVDVRPVIVEGYSQSEDDKKVAEIADRYIEQAAGETLDEKLYNAWDAAEETAADPVKGQDVHEAAAKHYLMNLYYTEKYGPYTVIGLALGTPIYEGIKALGMAWRTNENNPPSPATTLSVRWGEGGVVEGFGRFIRDLVVSAEPIAPYLPPVMY
jgi:RHS repeat-associated protein